VRTWRVSGALAALAAVACSPAEPTQPEAPPSPIQLEATPVPCEAGRFSSRDIENTRHAPADHDMPVETFLAGGRYIRLAMQGGTERGFYKVCADRVCIGQRTDETTYCRPLTTAQGGGLALEGERLRPYTPVPGDAPEVVWVRQAHPNSVLDVWPRAAREAGVSGSVVLRCQPQPNGAMGDCDVVEETPTGWGFGDAALKLVRYYRASPRYINQVQPGDRATFTVAFGPRETPEPGTVGRRPG
jgi:TonB family protein